MPYETNWLGKTIKHDEVFFNYGYEEFGSRLRVSKVISKLYGKKSNTLMKRHFNSARLSISGIDPYPILQKVNCIGLV